MGVDHDAVGVGFPGVNVAIDARSTAIVEVEETEGDASVDTCDGGAAAARASSLILESTRMRPSMRSAIVDCSLVMDVFEESPAMEESEGVWRHV